MNENEFLIKPEVAQRLRKTTRTIDAWMKAGIIPYIKIKKSVIFRWSDVLQSLTSRQ